MHNILILMDDITYGGGAHFATFHIANILSAAGHQVSIYSPIAATPKVRQLLSPAVSLPKQKNYRNFDTVIVPFENSMFRAEVAALRGVQKIQWVHIEYEKWKDLTAVDLAEQQALFAAFDKIVFVSEHNKQSFLRVFPQFSEKSFVVYNYLDEKSVQERAAEPLDLEIFQKRSPEQLNIVVSGRLEPQKAYHRLLDVAKTLNEQAMDIQWFVLGKGYEYDELRLRCKKHGLDNVHFLGFRKNPYAYVQQADVFALLSAYEGLALVLAESLTLGVPVISTESGGVREILSDSHGWVVPNHISDIVAAISAVYRDRSLLAEKRKNLKTYAYDNQRVCDAIAALIDAKTPKANKYKKCGEKKMAVVARPETVSVSVIVPVYNMEDYLVPCLDSLVNQTLEDLEIVIVNDGSTDNSIDIIEDYVYRYPEKIRAFTIENSGLGEARNYGISKARGKFLGFVDSDDYVAKNMFEALYSTALQNNSDCVLCDYIAVMPSGREEYVNSVDVPNADRFDILRYSTKYGVVNACTKLVAAELFEKTKFPKGFYEDLATMPIVLSHANNISYLRWGLYYYRQRSGSITSVKNNDKRLLDCFAAWDRIAAQGNPLFQKELAFAIYWSINFFCTNFLDDFTGKSKAYYDSHKALFETNPYIEEAVAKKEFLDFSDLHQIPKTIHYCWFGNNPKSELIEKCIASWKTFAPDFEIVEWNETNCNIHENPYVEEAYNKKMYAFVSDYFRLKALYEHGGVYMDTDMELMKSLEPHLYCPAFFAFETPIFVHAGIIGAVPELELIGKLLKSYQKSTFSVKADGSVKTIPMRITEFLEEDPSFVKNGKSQTLRSGIKLYSANKMTMDFHDGLCIANHHYEGSWMAKNNLATSANFGYEVMRHYFTWDLLQSSAKKTDIVDLGLLDQLHYYKSEAERLENSTCWKITAPLRWVGDFLKRLFRR